MNERDILGTGIILSIGGFFMLLMESSILTGMGFIMLCIGFPTAIAGAIKMYGDANGINKKSDENEALDILKTRFAKGEITKEEFEQVKKDLE